MTIADQITLFNNVGGLRFIASINAAMDNFNVPSAASHIPLVVEDDDEDDEDPSSSSSSLSSSSSSSSSAPALSKLNISTIHDELDWFEQRAQTLKKLRPKPQSKKATKNNEKATKVYNALQKKSSQQH